ncbi:uncharacterized protein MONBRDRAFT_6366 [Monosiga brevicollis MX1]|uniref:DUF300-domain-containing protein n=1 Tax=Monosiga brevicollis TaxID=81824 RepID=A9UTM6_MONBE|nr:uncharacterized protein MONBRDRAFT_6366 [Monosiga brevicollis MX1]EDQ91272.1 predicted protein [Monosiga brevicollis MX1]|eukprot:XP_001743694.1 hypothetical protein [Monosiga brevicollis MX1]
MSWFDNEPSPYGPTTATVFTQGNDRTFTLMTIAGAACFATCVTSFRHLRQYLTQLSHNTPRTLAIILVCVPPLFAISSFLGLLSPRGKYVPSRPTSRLAMLRGAAEGHHAHQPFPPHPGNPPSCPALAFTYFPLPPTPSGMFHLIRTAATVMAVFAYFKLIFWHLGGVTIASIRVAEEHGHEYEDHWLTKLPPLLPLRLCIPKIRMDVSMIRRCRAMVWQFFTMAPLTAFAQLWIILEKGTNQNAPMEQATLAMQALQTISMIVAVYGLFTIFFATKSLLTADGYQPLLKMLVVHVVFLINTLQSTLIPLLLALSSPPSVNAQQSSHDVWHPSYQTQAWKDFVVSCEMVILSLLIYKAFPVSDLLEYEQMLPGDRPGIGMFEDDYISHRIDNAASLLRRAATMEDYAARSSYAPEVEQQSPPSLARGDSFARLRTHSVKAITDLGMLRLLPPSSDGSLHSSGLEDHLNPNSALFHNRSKPLGRNSDPNISSDTSRRSSMSSASRPAMSWHGQRRASPIHRTETEFTNLEEADEEHIDLSESQDTDNFETRVTSGSTARRASSGHSTVPPIVVTPADVDGIDMDLLDGHPQQRPSVTSAWMLNDGGSEEQAASVFDSSRSSNAVSTRQSARNSYSETIA